MSGNIVSAFWKMEAFVLTGRKVDCAYTQGVTLGWELPVLQGVGGGKVEAK